MPTNKATFSEVTTTSFERAIDTNPRGFFVTSSLHILDRLDYLIFYSIVAFFKPGKRSVAYCV